MKPFRIIIIAMSILICYSCVDDISEPVGSCTFTAANNNDNNPYDVLYRQILDEYVANGFPGISIAIETPDHGWWVGAAGFAQLEEGIPMTPCHLHHAGLCTSTYTATLAMRLYEEGIIDLDDPIKDYLPDGMVDQIDNADEATIRQLLTETSGILDYDESLKMYVDAFNDPMVQNSAEYFIENYAYGKRAYGEPDAGKYWGYATGYALLTMIIEEASGITYGEYLKQEVADRIGLENTFFKEYAGSSGNHPVVNSYFEHFPGQLQNITDLQKNYTKNGTGGDQGILSTPYENARFLQELLWGNIVDSTTLELMIPGIDNLGMRIRQYDMDVGLAYGMHGGTVGGMIGMQYFPDDEITIVMTTNLGDVFDSKTTASFGNELILDIVSVTFTGERN